MGAYFFDPGVWVTHNFFALTIALAAIIGVLA